MDHLDERDLLHYRSHRGPMDLLSCGQSGLAKEESRLHPSFHLHHRHHQYHRVGHRYRGPMELQVGSIHLSLVLYCDRRHPSHHLPSSKCHHYHGPTEIVLHPRNIALPEVHQILHHCHHPNPLHLESHHYRCQHHKILGKAILDLVFLCPKQPDRTHHRPDLNLYHHHHCLHN